MSGTDVNNPGMSRRREGDSQMESSQTTAPSTDAKSEPETKKEKTEPTRYHVLRLSSDKPGKGASYEQLTETPLVASSRQQAIELVLADGHGNGAYAAVPERSFKPLRVKVEEVKTQKVSIQ